jgi:hypothetical protein
VTFVLPIWEGGLRDVPGAGGNEEIDEHCPKANART